MHEIDYTFLFLSFFLVPPPPPSNLEAGGGGGGGCIALTWSEPYI